MKTEQDDHAHLFTDNSSMWSLYDWFWNCAVSRYVIPKKALTNGLKIQSGILIEVVERR